MRFVRSISFAAVLVLAAACGGGGGSGDDTGDDDDGGADTIDANGTGGDGGGDHPDGMLPPGCDTPGETQCTDCIDNDGDGDIDGYDIECTGNADNDESDFATGIPGDNQDTVQQDCFFDGNSGAGGGDCNFHICCILSDPNCPNIYDSPAFDPEECTADQACIDYCADLTPPGCDCLGCCTICDDAGCVDIYINPNIAPNCDEDSIHDTSVCPACTKLEGCGEECDMDPTDCILCPGEDVNDLPEGCNQQECPADQAACDADTPCGEGLYCSNGCCIEEIIVN